jgi:hypothetical protein
LSNYCSARGDNSTTLPPSSSSLRQRFGIGPKRNAQLFMEREILSRVASWFVDDEIFSAKNGTHDS